MPMIIKHEDDADEDDEDYDEDCDDEDDGMQRRVVVATAGQAVTKMMIQS